jgi:protocatechuate 3,4-dioxygenase beta subunit
MNQPRMISRRDFVYLGLGGGLLVVGFPLGRVLTQPAEGSGPELFKPTPSNTLGPFYKKGAPRREKLNVANADGTPLLVAGRVINTQGRVLSDATVEVFHSDAHGNYDMNGFHCRGEIPVGRNGEYKYESVVPGQYGGRAQHVHYVISAPGHKRLVTQLYFENDPKFEGNPDRNYTKDDLVWHRELIRPVATIKRNNIDHASVEFNICLETV